jgi:hypothetical protein
MDFVAVVDQVITLLRQRGRLTSRETIIDDWRWPTTEEARHDQSIR